MRGLRGIGMLGGFVAVLGGGLALAQTKPPAQGAPQPVPQPGSKFAPSPAPSPATPPLPDKFANPPVIPPPVPPRAQAPGPTPGPGPAQPTDKFGTQPPATTAPAPPAAAPVPPNEPAALGQLRALLGPGVGLTYRSATVADTATGAVRLTDAELRHPDGQRIAAGEMLVDRPRPDGIAGLTASTVTVTGTEGKVTAIGRAELRDLTVARPAPGETLRPDQLSLGLLRLEALAVQGDRPVAIAEVMVQDYRPGGPGRASLAGIDVLVPEGGGVGDRVKVGRIALEGVDLPGTFAALAEKEAPPRPPGAYNAAVEGVTVTQGGTPVGSLGALRITGALDQSGPDTGRITLEGLRVEPFPMIALWLQRLGYQALTGDFSVETRMDQAAGRLELVGMLLGVRDAGALGLSLTLEGVAPDGATQDRFQAARLAGFALRYLDQSLLQRLAAAEARQSRRPERQVRDGWASQAAGAMGGGIGAVAPVLSAVQRLLRGQAQEVTITAQPPKPVPIAELSGAAAGGAEEVQRVLGITATAR
ncbi:hypothetical protein [Belnapia rosea]|uniref:Uncharacterized protein n=1 Tax=Belnapia rosea TaxID=938405 RepID=A0A1G7BHZ3_9PROT|nr:hypothetical protein [Belnapia rosea]SDE26649.1 hypothetical protein SAMN04487779_102538 [Belnapia rosea]